MALLKLIYLASTNIQKVDPSFAELGITTSQLAIWFLGTNESTNLKWER
jgi:hypothetical protein